MENDKNNKQPSVSYWHVWTDDEGISRQTLTEIKGFEKEGMGDIEEQWNAHVINDKAHVMFSELPVGWKGDWHENPEPQWIIPLSGKWFVETMDGHRVEMGPGDVSFGADQNTKKDDKGRKGHLSGTVGNVPARLMMIQLKDKKYEAAKPGIFSGNNDK